MRKVLIAGLLMLGAVSTKAGSDADDVWNSSCTANKVLVASVTATSPTRMDYGASDLGLVKTVILMDNRKLLRIDNQDINSIPFRCDFSSITLPVSAQNYGIILASSGTLSLPMRSRDANNVRMTFWCRSTGVAESTATVTQCGSR